MRYSTNLVRAWGTPQTTEYRGVKYMTDFFMKLNEIFVTILLVEIPICVILGFICAIVAHIDSKES